MFHIIFLIVERLAKAIDGRFSRKNAGDAESSYSKYRTSQWLQQREVVILRGAYVEDVKSAADKRHRCN